ncbi:MAG: hypothetical protein ACN4GF_01900, partial [Lentimonas sp.]
CWGWRVASNYLLPAQPPPPPPQLILLLLACPFIAHAQAATGIRVIEEGAIPFARFLSKADFDQRYPSEIISAPSALDTGWYVIYEHESLSYYFGPILLESTGQDYFEQLKATVGDAVSQRPTIEGYRLELSYEPQTSAADSPSTTPPEAGESSTEYGDPPPPEKTSIFSFFKRLFGFS